MSERKLTLKNGFAWCEKLAMRGGLAIVVGIGALAIYRSNPAAAVGYLLFVALAGLVVMYDSLCVYCPYPFKHSDCLFFPYQLLARVTTRRTGSIPWFRNALSALAFLGIAAIPQCWLWGQWALFATFWVLLLTGGVAVPLVFCKSCRHTRCPMNLVKLQLSARHEPS